MLSTKVNAVIYINNNVCIDVIGGRLTFYLLYYYIIVYHINIIYF